jgi:ABC-type sugar transport system ATPase subunit
MSECDKTVGQSRQLGQSLLAATGISKKFGRLDVLKSVSLVVSAGEIHAVCGENGAGKSTLVKILMGVFRPDAGSIRINGRQVNLKSPRDGQDNGIALVAQELSLAPDLSVEDNIWLGSNQVPIFHRSSHLRRRAANTLEMLGLPPSILSQYAGKLSIAERQLVEIARNLCRDARILILDEPTATLSDADIRRLFVALDNLRRQGRSTIYITHRMGEVFQICDSVTVLRNGEVVTSQKVGNISKGELIESMIGTSVEDLYGPPPSSRPRQSALAVHSLSIPGRVHGVAFDVHAGEIVGIAGQIGSGAGLVVRALAGLVPTAVAKLSYRDQAFALRSRARMRIAGVDFITEDRAAEGVFLERTVQENLTATNVGESRRYGFFVDTRCVARIASLAAAQVGIDQGRMRHAAWTLSGGNQQKLLFGRANRSDNRKSRLLLMIEPTRGVDIGARSDLYQIIRAFADREFGVLMHTTDLEELLGLSDVILTMFGGKVVNIYKRGTVTQSQILTDITHAPQASKVS